MKHIISIIILSLVLFSCAKEESDDSATTELEGTWVTSCNVYSDSLYRKLTTVVSATNFTVNYEYFSDSNCTTAASKWVDTQTSLSIGDAMVFSTYGASGGSGHQFTVYHNSTTAEWQNASDVSWANTNSLCGETDWELNTAQDVAGKTCDETEYWSSGTSEHCQYLLDGSSLYFQCAKDT
jgi:hypothetical protein